jgi:hypothetical protein
MTTGKVREKFPYAIMTGSQLRLVTRLRAADVRNGKHCALVMDVGGDLFFPSAEVKVLLKCILTARTCHLTFPLHTITENPCCAFLATGT